MKTINGNYKITCFGYVDGRFFGGHRHHMGIMQFILEHGYDFESLMAADQTWGWITDDPTIPYSYNSTVMKYRISTDAASIDQSLSPQVAAALTAISGVPAQENVEQSYGQSNAEYAPNYQSLYESDSSYYKDNKIDGCYIYDSRTHWQGFVPSSDTESQFPPPKAEPEFSNQLTLFDDSNPNGHPVPGGGMPPPKLTWYEDPWIEDMIKEAMRLNFVYDVNNGRIEASPYDHHYDLLEKHGLDENNIERHAFGSSPRYLFGEQGEGEAPFVHTSDYIPQDYQNQALAAFEQWKNSNGYDMGDDDFLALRQSSDDARFLGPSAVNEYDRVAWLIDFKGQLKMTDLDSGAHHIDIGWAGDEIATGDILIGMDSHFKSTDKITLRVLSLDPQYDWGGVVDRVEKAWDSQHPNMVIDDFENLGHEHNQYGDDEDEDLTTYGSYDILGAMTHIPSTLSEPTEHDNWKVYEMESGEYQNHHAIVVDRYNNAILINYHGHHYPMMAQVNAAGIPFSMDGVQGHYRLEPSQDEPFSEGWGFHHGEATPVEKEIMREHMAAYHGVEDLHDAWIANKQASIEWLPICDMPGLKVSWQAIWDRNANHLYLWQTCGDDKHHIAALVEKFPTVFTKTGQVRKASRFVQAEGTYLHPSYVIAPGSKDPVEDTERVTKLINKAVIEKWGNKLPITAPPKKLVSAVALHL